MNKTYIIGLRVTGEEKGKIAWMAENAGLSVSNFIRRMLCLDVSGRINSETGVISLNHDDPAQLDRE